MEKRKIIDKKGQLGLEDGPNVILIVGLIFLIMATVALVSEEYGTAVGSDIVTLGLVNQTTTNVNDSGVAAIFPNYQDGRLRSCSLTVGCATNSTGALDAPGGPNCIPAGNYTVSGCTIAFSGTANDAPQHNDTTFNITGTMTYLSDTTAYNVTEDLQVEISDNTSLAGVVLTIALVGIVLGVLIGIFVGFSGTRI